MKIAFPLTAAAAALVFLSPVGAHNPTPENSPQPAAEASNEGDEGEREVEASAPIEVPAITAPASQSPAAADQAREEELICRSIRLDMSSRRKTRVCRTEEGWRQLNQQR